MADAPLLIAFVAGLASFLSPCILPLLPAFLAYLAGTAGQEIQHASAGAKIFLNTLFFVAGFALIFSLLGILLNSVLVSSSFTIRIWLGRIGGLVIILFGLYLLGLIRI